MFAQSLAPSDRPLASTQTQASLVAVRLYVAARPNDRQAVDHPTRGGGIISSVPRLSAATRQEMMMHVLLGPPWTRCFVTPLMFAPLQPRPPSRGVTPRRSRTECAMDEPRCHAIVAQECSPHVEVACRVPGPTVAPNACTFPTLWPRPELVLPDDLYCKYHGLCRTPARAMRTTMMRYGGDADRGPRLTTYTVLHALDSGRLSAISSESS
nr:hypothetical protein CFP56_19482 [Quercus suber]